MLVKVSIIVPLYNASNFLEQFINNILEQTLKDIELICIDCGSIDESKKILKKLSEKYNCIKFFSQESISLGKGRNYGIDNSDGEYIFFMTPSEFFTDTNSLEILYDMAKKNNANMVSGNIRYNSPTDDIISTKCYYFDKYYKINAEKYGVPIAFNKNIYKKSFLKENNIYFADSNNYQDLTFLSQMFIALDEVYGCPIDLNSYNSDLYDAIDSPEKKFHHLAQFKKSFDILENNNLNNISEKLKLELMDFFKTSMTNNDLEIYEMSLDVFGKTPTYFQNELKNQYNLFLSHHMIHKISFENNEEYFQDSKNDLNTLNLLDNNLLPNELLKNLVLVLNSNTYEEYNLKLHDFKMDILNNENEKLVSKRDMLKKSIHNQKTIKQSLNKAQEVNAKNIDLKNKNDKLSNDNKQLIDKNIQLSQNYNNKLNENNQLSQNYNNKLNENNQLNTKINVLTEENQRLTNENNFLSEDNYNLNNKIQTLTEDNQKLINQNYSLTENNAKLKNKMRELSIDNKNLEKSISEMNKEILKVSKENEMMMSSKSWKITSPLRSMKKNTK